MKETHEVELIGRWSMALFASLALGLGMTACGGGTIGYMWVLGQEYNQVAGFKVDQYSGNLTEVPGSPFSSNGSVPVSIVIKSGGRFVYVINQGVGGGPNARAKVSRLRCTASAATASWYSRLPTAPRDTSRSGRRWTPAARTCMCWTSILPA